MISGNVKNKTAVIIGAGPAGLTAAYELLKHTDIHPIVLEKSHSIGGISKTVDYKGNKIDLGGHRFFSKSEEIMNWWQQVFPLCNSPENIAKNDTWDTGSDNVFLQRDRLSRIYYLRSFFDYPVELNKNTVRKLGLIRILKIGFSYLKSRLFPIKHEKSLEHFFINRFGKALYETFFKDYTEKVWGIPCSKLSAEWGAQRIKGLSASKVLTHYLKSFFSKKKNDVSQKNTETSLIELFLYPKYGPGQLWEAIAVDIAQKGGDVQLLCEFSSVRIGNQGKFHVEYLNKNTGETTAIQDVDYLFSSAAV
ncbi:MAG TPA: NAD(P)-binding protein, partial [Bacteroidales bacterium]|nr:NAD(P)-binding protein [Bacteroidales bacterium]